ncbi:hypothetical protein KBB12_03140 [Candidatus Woesebacteria bacterium]|nr:hypothetical protein [Candidatus Woesebacteria bacterium]
MDSKVVWLADYIDKDVDVHAKALDLGLPMPYGFVVPRSVLHSTFLNLKVQEKLIPLFEFTHDHDPAEVLHTQTLVHKIIDRVKIPHQFTKQIIDAYEHISEKERTYLRMHVSDLHKAVGILKHVYAPMVVRISSLPYSTISLISSGEQSVLHSISLVVTQYLQQNIAQGRPLDLPSILVQRVQNGQFSGYCETINQTRSDMRQMVVYGNIGAQALEETGDVYVLEKDSMKIIHRHVLSQPYKYVLKGNEYKRISIHEEEGKRQTLPDSLIMKIGYLAKDIEKKLYFPQKVYWTLENGIIYVTKLKQI